MAPVLFIDANAYLELFGTAKGKELLATLNEQRELIFTTTQIVNEVERNKLRVAKAFFDDKLKKLAVPGSGIPDHLFDSETTKHLYEKLKDVNKRIDELNKDFASAVAAVLGLISQSQDEVSKALQTVFSGAVKHDSNQLQRARERKELGIPPGKKEDPLGDELSWEQLRDHLREGSQLWLITNDSDFRTVHETQSFLNPVLRQELKNIEVFCYSHLGEGISAFAKSTGAGKQKLPSDTTLEEIKKEAESLPPYWPSVSGLDWMSPDDAMPVNNNAYRLQRMAALLGTEGTSTIDPKVLGTPK